MGLIAARATETTIEIGSMPILVRTDSAEFLKILERRYGGFVNATAEPLFELNVEIVPAETIGRDEDVSVDLLDGRWILRRGDFYAEWNPADRRGIIRQAANPYAIDTAMRILHSLLLAEEEGLLVHASSVVRNGRAFLFSGVSGAGKTTMAKLAPENATLLTDEISYLRRQGEGYVAFGTPFAGDLAKPGENISAPLEAIYFLSKGAVNKIESIPEKNAIRGLLECVLFFAKDSELVQRVFHSTCDLVRRIPVRRLTFVPDARVWELIG